MSNITFNGETRVATLGPGTTILSVTDIWSRWNDWLSISDNSKYYQMFAQVGGDPIDASAGTSIPFYMFLLNGWKICPQSASHTLNVVSGVLIVDGGGDPFINPVGGYTIRINYSQPVQAITVSTAGASGPTADSIATAVWAALTSTMTDKTTIGGYIHRVLLSIPKFLTLK